MVDEITGVSTTDYLSTSLAGDLSILSHGGLSETPTSLHAVQTVYSIAKMEAGNRTFRAVLKQGATVYNGQTDGTTNVIGKWHWNLWLTNPATSTAWTKATVDSVDFGFEVIT